VALAAWLGAALWGGPTGCVKAVEAPPAERAPVRGKPFTFAWPESQVTIEESIEAGGESLTLRWIANVTAEGSLLRVSFPEGALVEGPKEAVAPSGSHPLWHVMPDLLVHPTTGALVRVDKVRQAIDARARIDRKSKLSKEDERALKTSALEQLVSNRAAARWAAWTRLVGFDQAPDSASTVQESAPSEDGLTLPVEVTTTHKRVGEAALVRVKRSFSGDAVTRMFRATLALNGAPIEVAEGVEKVIREEEYEAETDPRTLQSTRIRVRQATTVHSTAPEAGVHIDTATESWTFDWAGL
jgi:hypothetical protein